MSDPKKDAVERLRVHVLNDPSVITEADHCITTMATVATLKGVLAHIATLEADVADLRKTVKWEVDARVRECARVAELEAEVERLSARERDLVGKVLAWESMTNRTAIEADALEARVAELEDALREYNEWWADMGPKHPVHEKARALLNREDT